MPEPYRPDLATDGARALDWLRLVRSDVRWLYAFVAGAWVLSILAVVLGIEATNAPAAPWQPRTHAVTSRHLNDGFTGLAPGESRVAVASMACTRPGGSLVDSCACRDAMNIRLGISGDWTLSPCREAVSAAPAQPAPMPHAAAESY